MDDTIAKRNYTTRFPRDSFCVTCGASFRTGLCSHHDVHIVATGEPLNDAVLRSEEHDEQHCVPCTGDEWWMDVMGVALGDPVLTGVDEEVGILRAASGAQGDQDQMPPLSRRDDKRETERRQRRVARHAARQSGNN
uniref:Uncharacterized protein n=1 Tax=Leersia perrieri TaxID=77586 RepID=A0A0D9UZ37_9ORYZ